MFNDSDEYDFNPSNSSKLANLFGNTKISDDGLNSSLTYTAPKQPKAMKKQDVNESIRSKPQTSVLLAKIVTLWILENKDYKSLGKHGLAVIGSADLNMYEIIAYKEKNNIILRIRVNDKICFYNKKDYFSTFYDHDNQNWLAKFENANDQDLFCKTIESHGAKIVNNIENTVENDKVQPKTSGKENEIGFSKDISHNNQQEEDLSVKELDVNSDSSGSYKRANILSRMAKMGQQILPTTLVKNTSTDISDSELDDSKIERKVPPRKFKRVVHTERNITPREEKPPQMIQQDFVDSQMVPSQNTLNNYAVQLPQNFSTNSLCQPMQYDGFNHFIMAQNTELKMNLAQISAKLDNALSQNNTNQSKTEDSAYKSKIKVLELKISNLESELARYGKKYSNLEKMYNELEEKYNNEEVTSIDDSIVRHLKEEIDNLNASLKDKEETINVQEELKQSLQKYQGIVQEHEKTIELQKTKIKELGEFYEQNKDNTNMQFTIDELNTTILSLKEKVKEFEEYHQKTEKEKEKRNEENDRFVKMFSDKIKEHMNSMYQSVLSSFHEGDSYSVSDINSSVAQNLKGTTFKIISELKSIYSNKNTEQ